MINNFYIFRHRLIIIFIIDENPKTSHIRKIKRHRNENDDEILDKFKEQLFASIWIKILESVILKHIDQPSDNQKHRNDDVDKHKSCGEIIIDGSSVLQRARTGVRNKADKEENEMNSNSQKQHPDDSRVPDIGKSLQ